MAKMVRSTEKVSFWRNAIDRQVASGLSVRAFCRSQSIREASFYSWRQKLNDRNREKTPVENRKLPTGKVTPDFVSAMVGTLASETSIVLELASGCRLMFPTSTPIPRLAELVLALESRGNR